MAYNINIPGFMSVKDLQIVESLAKEIPRNGTIIEVGSFMGRSAWTFAKSADPSVSVYCIDRWEDFAVDSQSASVMAGYEEGKKYDFEAFKNYVKDCPNIIPIKSKSTEAKWPKNKKVDLIFIDASHKSPDVEEDLAYWFPHLKENGILCGHDFDVLVFPDVCRAVISFSIRENLPITFFRGSTIWLIEQSPSLSSNEETLVSTPFLLAQIEILLEQFEKKKNS